MQDKQLTTEYKSNWSTEKAPNNMCILYFIPQLHFGGTNF